MKHSSIVIFPVLALIAAMVCSGCHRHADTSAPAPPSRDTLITEARLLHIVRTPSCTYVDIRNPWTADTAMLHRYALVPADSTPPANLPADVTVVRTPLQRALVYSAVHTGVFKELGCFDAVAGITDSQFFSDPDIMQRLHNGTVADCGSSMTPTIERIIDIDADAVLLSPYQDATYGQVAKLGIPIIECADYMEYTPLGRAEWLKFYGLLLGREKQADSIFNITVGRYNALRQRAQEASHRPTVLTETVINGIWNVPGGQSYMARLLRDAGARYFWDDTPDTGSLNLDFAQVLDRAQDADFWLIKSFAIHSYADLHAQYALNNRFSAFAQRHVYACDTNASRLFEFFPFHPELLLADFFAIFHPELRQPDDAPLRFYHPLQP